MMTRKKRITLIIVIVVLVLLIIGGIFTFLYLNTDMFKSNQTLFVKYLQSTLVTSHDKAAPVMLAFRPQTH